MRKFDSYIEYVESTGLQYVDTGFKPSSDSVLIVDQQFTTVDANNGFGTAIRKGGFAIRQRIDMTMLYTISASRLNYNSRVSSDTNRHLYRLEANRCRLYIDGVNRTYSEANWNGGGNNHNIILLGFTETLGEERILSSHARLYEAILTIGGKEVFHAFPVRIGQNGFLYDSVEDVVLATGGSGNLIPGPDIEGV